MEEKQLICRHYPYGGGPPPYDSMDTRGVLFFLPSYTPGNAYREVYTMAFSSISHRILNMHDIWEQVLSVLAPNIIC